MKNKIFLGLLSLVAGLSLASCVEEPLNIPTEPILNESSVVTGSADVTATSATLHGTVEGLDGMAAASYMTAFYYGYSADALTESVTASYDGNAFTATLTGLQTNVTVYYQAYVRLQGKVYYKGEVKSLVTTTAKVVTKSAAEVGANSAVIGGTVTDAPEGAVCGILISASSDVEKVRTGVNMAAEELTADYSLTRKGLLPDTEYSYVAYLDLGSGVVYGDVESFTTASQTFDLDNDLVDLGLSVKWAKYNVGASTESELGGLFGFGDLNGVMTSINPADYAAADTYKTVADLAFNVTDGKATLPTAADFEELFSLCKKEWTEVDGVAGYRLTGPNGNSIFLPAAGTRTQSSVKGEGVEGYYLTGTVNPTNASFAVTYQFNQGLDAKTTTPVYQAVAVRPVSTAKNVPFKKELLYTKWYLDNGQGEEQKQHVFEGPYTQYGVTDSWATISNGQPNIEQSIYWEMGTNNGWIGYTYGKDYGYMEFLEDGTFNVHRIAEDGTVTDETGTFTVDEDAKTITVDVDVIHGNTWLPAKKGTLKILTLTEDGVQIMLDAGDGTYGYALNYYSEAKRVADEKLTASFVCVDSNWTGTWGTELKIAPAELNGSHTIVYEAAMDNVMIFYLDVQKLAAKYPGAIVTVTDIKCDDVSIEFDPSKFFYGDIENNGNFRIELFNIYGKGAADGNVISSPFSASANVANEPAVHFTSKIEVTFYIVLNPVFTPSLVTINPSWGGTWGHNQGASMTVAVDENSKLKMNNAEFDITYESADHAAGSIMTFIEVADLFGAFPATDATLNKLYLDGQEVTYDPAKVLDTNEGAKYRLELWNCYGATKGAGCAFGEPEGDVMAGLAFTSSMRTVFTFDSIFPTVVFE